MFKKMIYISLAFLVVLFCGCSKTHLDNDPSNLLNNHPLAHDIIDNCGIDTEKITVIKNTDTLLVFSFSYNQSIDNGDITDSRLPSPSWFQPAENYLTSNDFILDRTDSIDNVLALHVYSKDTTEVGIAFIYDIQSFNSEGVLLLNENINIQNNNSVVIIKNSK